MPSPHIIGIDARMYGAEQTGIGTYIKEVTGRIFERDKEHRYLMFMLEPEFSRFSASSSVKKVLVRSPWYSLREQVRFPLELLREKVDLMHFPHFNTPLLYPGKMVVTIHDLTPRFFPGHKMDSFWRRKGFEAVFSSSLVKARHVITVSEATKREVMRYYRLPERKISVVHEGIKSFPRISDEKKRWDRIAERFSLTKPYIFYVGVWRTHKNLVGLIEAFAILRNTYGMDIQLVLGGKEDPYYPEVRARWHSLGLEESVVNPGFIPEADLPLFYSHAAIFAFPSFSEGFGFVGLEAGMFGTPVAASRIPALQEVMGNGAVYFDPSSPADMAEKIHHVLTEPALRDDLRTRLKERVRRYDWDRCARETLEIYKKSLGHPTT